MVPFRSVMISVTGNRKLFMKWVRVSASSFSERLVNPLAAK